MNNALNEVEEVEQVERLKARVRTFVTEGHMARTALAIAAGMGRSSLNDLHDDAWNPTADTLKALLATIRAHESRPKQTACRSRRASIRTA